MKSIHRKQALRILALAAAVVVAAFAVSGGKVAAFQHEHAAAPAGASPAQDGRDARPQTSMAATGERKILYWYDGMNPQHRYDKPGKAPDGMDLVPMYADAAPKGERKILYWYDPMHPKYRSDKPGIAPDCGMQLVPKYADDALNLPPGTVMVSPDRQQLMGVRTTKVERQRLERDISTTGQVAVNETRLAHVHVKVSGFIEKVFVDYPGQGVRKGQPLFTLYSPDLVATEQEYLIAKRGEKSMSGSEFPSVAQGAQSLLASARERLKLWDISDEQIKKLDETGEVSRTLTFYSPASGIVQDRKAFPQTSVTPDTELYTVADLSTVWVNADVYEYEAPYVRVGQPVEMRLSYYPGKVWRGRIGFIYPQVDPQSRTVKARIDVPNPGLELKPQMFADVTLKVDYGNVLVVPEDAVLDSGRQQTVFVALGDGHFEPRTVTTGAHLEGKVAILFGLNAGDTIVASGNFLIDSESQLKSAMGEMQH